MPELPEIETIRRDLEKTLAGDRALTIKVFDPRLMRRREAGQWEKSVIGQVWKGFQRKGKYLWVELANDWRVVFHMRMTGQLIVSPHPAFGRLLPKGRRPRAEYGVGPLPLGEGARRAGEGKPRMLLQFASGRSLGLYDQRRFAEAWLLAPGKIWHNKHVLGPDALNELQRDQFVEIIKARTTRIQPLLMDQRLMSGIGNIYAQEALFKAAIRPTRPGNRVTKVEATLLYETLQETLQTAIENRGSSSRNYRDANGEQGFAQKLHAVYRKGGKPCPRCKAPLRSTRVGGRGSVFCAQCQK
jgi:formamidopyrimidine-DNA glycosylase